MHFSLGLQQLWVGGALSLFHRTRKQCSEWVSDSPMVTQQGAKLWYEVRLARYRISLALLHHAVNIKNIIQNIVSKEMLGLSQLSLHSLSSPETNLSFSLNCKNNHGNMKVQEGGTVQVLIRGFWRRGCGRLEKMAVEFSHPCVHTPCDVTLQLFPSRKVCFSISWSWSWTHDLLWPTDMVSMTETEFASFRTWGRPGLASRRGHDGEEPGSLTIASLWVKLPVPAEVPTDCRELPSCGPNSWPPRTGR